MHSTLTKALIFKPKKLIDSWEHKHGFRIEFDAGVAFNLIESAKSARKYSGIKVKNYHLNTNSDLLRDSAIKKLYIIQSSHNNYIDWISAGVGLSSLVYIFTLIPHVWSGSNLLVVRALMVSALLLVVSIALYVYKKRVDKSDIDYFLDIDDALYIQEYGESQYR